jgi:hypothetical protein
MSEWQWLSDWVTEWVTLQLPQLALMSHLFRYGYRAVGKGYALCKVRSETWETGLIFVTGCVFSNRRSEAEEIVEYWVWLWAARPRDHGLISDKRIRFVCSLVRQDWLWNMTNFLCSCVQEAIFLKVNLSGREPHHLLPSNVKIKSWVHLYFNCLIRVTFASSCVIIRFK